MTVNAVLLELQLLLPFVAFQPVTPARARAWRIRRVALACAWRTERGAWTAVKPVRMPTVWTLHRSPFVLLAKRYTFTRIHNPSRTNRR
jgi:hypothetical protein